MRYRLALAAVILQVLALAYLAGEREWILRTGRTILLRTAPVDPQDPMRGDYVRLDYEIGRVSRQHCEGNLAKLFAQAPADYRDAGRRVYARLETDENGVANLVALTDEKPGEGIFIRGRAKNSYGNRVDVSYGIEALFMEQGRARELEAMRFGERPGVPLDIEVALDSSGSAVLKNYHWEPLGITLAFERPPASPEAGRGANPGRTPQLIVAVAVELKNYGPEDVAIVDLPEGGSLRLVADDRWQEPRYRWVGEDRPVPPPKSEQVYLLKSGESHRMKLDLTSPAWFVINTQPDADKTPIPMRDVTEPWSASFRIEYVPPSRASVAGLPHASLIRPGRLRSRAFNPMANVD